MPKPTFLLIALVLITFAACDTTNRRNGDPVVWNPTPVEQPAWVKSGEHPALKAPDWISTMRTRKSVSAPSRGAMLRALREAVHLRLADTLHDALADAPVTLQALSRGVWVTPDHIPLDDWRYQEWSDGELSSAFAAISLQALAQHNAAKLKDYAAIQGPRDLAKENRADDALPNSLSRLRRRTLHVTQDLNQLVTHMLALAERWGISEGEAPGPDGPLIARLEQSMVRLQTFPERVRVARASGGDQQIKLSSTPAQDIELVLREGGGDAAGLPITPVLDGLDASDFSVETDEQGHCAIRLAGPVAYTGKSEHRLGFVLDPDRLIDDVKTGVAIQPWTVRAFLPAAGNVAVILNVTEKIDNISREPEDAVVVNRLRAWLDDAGISIVSADQAREAMAADTPAEERRFYFELSGVIAVHEQKGTGRTSRRTYRAEGLLSLRTWRGPVLASTKVFGVTEFFGDDAARAARQALDNLWTKDAPIVRRQFREAFPPIFPRGE